jgi:hypothetical protein
MKKSLLLIAVMSIISSSTWAAPNHQYPGHGNNHGSKHPPTHRNDNHHGKRYWHQAKPYHHPYNRSAFRYGFRDHGSPLLKIKIR